MQPDYFCVHVHGAHDIAVYDHRGHGHHRLADDDDLNAFYEHIIRAALHDRPGRVIDIVSADRDFLRALDRRRNDDFLHSTETSHHHDLGT